MIDEPVMPTSEPSAIDQAKEDPFVLPESQGEVAGVGTSIIKSIFKPAKVPVKQAQEKKLVETIEKKVVEGAPEEAERVNKLEFSDFDTDETYHVNFDMIETTDEVKSVIADTSERFKGTIDEARRGKITQAELQGLADDLNVKADVIQPILERETGGTLNAETILASRKVLNNSAKRITTLAQKISSGEATDKEKLSFMRQIQFHNEYQAGFMGARAEAGRALNAFSIPVGDDPTTMKRMSELINTVHGGRVETMAKALASADNVAEVGRIAKLNWKEKVGGVLFENFINSILSGVKTHVINTAGNALFQTMNLAETAVAAQIGRFASGEERTRIGEASARMFGTISAFREATKVAWKGLKTGEGGEVSKMETRHKKMISAETLEASGPLGRVIDMYGSLTRIPTERMLTAGDEFFKTMARRGVLAQQAYRDATKKAEVEGWDSNQISAHITDFMNNPPEAVFTQMNDEALYQTFQMPLGEIGQSWQKTVAKTPGFKYITPFMRTPINIFKGGLLERSPLGVFSRQFREDIKTPGPKRDLALARVSMGTLTMVSVAVAVDSGLITGGGPSNPQARKALEATGWKPYSIVWDNPVTGKREYQSYQRAEPFAYVIGATADMVEIARYTDWDDETADGDEQINRLGAAIIAGIAENTMSKTFLSGIADFSQMTSDPARYAKTWAQRMLAAQIPFSALRRDLAKIQDPYVRDAWDFKEKLRATGGIPGWSEGSPPKLNLYGEPLYHPRGDILGVLSPAPNKPKTTDRVKLEVANVMTESRRVAVGMPSKRVEGMKLTNIEYNKMVKYARSEHKVDGRTFKDALGKMMDSSLYQNATVDTKATLLQDITKSYNKAGVAFLMKNDSDFMDRLKRHKAIKAKRQVGEENLPANIQNLLN